MQEPCDGCGESVKIGGSQVNLWTFEGDETGGITLELEGGGEFFLCYECIERLPDDEVITPDHVADLSE